MTILPVLKSWGQLHQNIRVVRRKHLMEEIWSVAKDFFPSQVELARQQIESDAAESSMKTRIVSGEKSINVPQPIHRQRLAHRSKHTIRLIPNDSQDTAALFPRSRKGSLKASIEVPIRNLERSLSRFDEMYANMTLDAKIWGNIPKARR